MEELATANNKYKYELLTNVHTKLEPPTVTGKSYLIRGNYEYFHYDCDGYSDVGWGCGYRTLQSMCSWILNNRNDPSTILSINKTSDTATATTGTTTPPSDDINNIAANEPSSYPFSNIVPSIPQIQTTLVDIADKPSRFFGSKEWIGALEVFYVIDTLYDIPCKILHIPSCEDVKKYTNVIKHYFDEIGGLIMMGGDLDASSKGICGIHINDNEAYLLVIDPHLVGIPKTPEELIDMGFLRWQHSSEFVDSSFYNLCMPQLKIKDNN